jgi:flagellar hook-associated protein 3 FlgL
MIYPRQTHLHRLFAETAIPAAQRDIERLREVLATGVDINRASDDAPRYHRARSLDNVMSRLEGYERNVKSASSVLDHTQNHLSSITERFMKAQELAIQGNTASMGQSERNKLADTVETLLDATLDDLNARVGDRYLFGGTIAGDSPKPFQKTAAGVAYGGNAGEREVQISETATARVNLSGEAVVQTGAGHTITGALEGLAAALRGELGAPTLDDALARVEGAREHVTAMNAEAGERSNRLRLAGDRISSAQLTSTQERSRVEDADYLETATELQRAESRMQAALQVGARQMQTTLLDYLR